MITQALADGMLILNTGWTWITTEVPLAMGAVAAMVLVTVGIAALYALYRKFKAR